MTLGNMRADGVRSLSVSCWLCNHGAVLAVDLCPDDVPVPSFGPHLVCTGCGIVGADARPNWTEGTIGDKLPIPVLGQATGTLCPKFPEPPLFSRITPKYA
jgi:hypothetical protein